MARISNIGGGSAQQGGGTWGSITGTLSNQTDLQNSLNAKANVSGQVFTGAISATNLSGTNTGDQNLSAYLTAVTADSPLSGSGTAASHLTVDLSSKMNALTPTAVKSTNYNANVGELIPCDTSGGAFQITLPTAPANMSIIQIKIVKTGGTSNTLTVVTGGSDVFNIAGGNTTVYMTILSEVQTLQYNSGIWYNVLTAAPSNFATNFPGIDATTPITASDISINYTTRVLTITPPLGYFRFFVDGGGVISRFVKTGAVNFPAFTDTSGAWFFYFDSSGVATVSQTDPQDTLGNVCEVYQIIWNSTLAGSAKAVIEGYEVHLNTIPAIDHEWKHDYGAIWDSGFVIANNVLASGTPNADGRNAVVALSTGTNMDDNLRYTITNSTGGAVWQQDLGNTTPASLNATNSALFQVRYQDGSARSFVLAATRFPFDWDSGTNVPNFITSTGTRTPITDKNFFVYYIYASQDARNGKALKVISATAQFTSLTLAQASSWTDIVNTYTTLSEEVRPLFKMIFEYRASYNVGSKFSVLREVNDLRKVSIPQLTNTAGSLPASSITVVPAGNIASTNAQSALEELDTEKLALAGGTMTGNLLFTDNTLDIGASGATRPRTGYFGTSVVIAGATALVSGGALGTPASGTLTNCTFPTLNQDTTGSAVYWKTSGTGKGAISGPATGTTRTYTFPDADSTILYSGGALGTPASGTLTNCTGLPISGLVSLVPASSGGTTTGETITLTSTETQAVGDAVQIDVNGKAHLAKADAIANASAVLLAAAAVTGSASNTYLRPGGTMKLASSPSWTIGGLVYLSTTGTTGNTLTQTAPSATNNVIQVLGVALAADTLLFMPSLTQVEHT